MGGAEAAQIGREARARLIAHVRDPRADEIARLLIPFIELVAAHGDYLNLDLPRGKVEREAQRGILVVEVAGAEAEGRDDEPDPRLAQVARAPDERLRGPRPFVVGLLVEYGDAKKETRVVARRAAAVADRTAQAAQ